ncbi:Xin actin-binding repeat-containing protein 2 [Liparis tanakae]|uniref:Xin actin-binding repeat-containing protein 2 n=1 Tax=Liparis tanakae TaxID=230148 RepID=A0A4Z2H7Q5_9TELE|nr:Xin actin-binding repeat-containing protein 2 [Liparis tanakae]
MQKESPKPPKKSFVPPLKLPPPPEPAPAAKPRPYARKFKTPLMLAEEKYRLQTEKEESERSNVTTPTSPPIKMPSFAASPEPHAALGVETEEATEVTQAKREEAKIVSNEAILPAKKIPSQIPLSKPSISVCNKKSASGSSNVSVDKKHVAADHSEKMASADVVHKSQTAHRQQTQAVSVSQASVIEKQSCVSVVTSSVTEQQQLIKKSSSRSIAVQENANLQSQAAVTLKAEDVTNSNAALTQEGKTSPSQPTKIPKVTPSFKVKTFKMPTEKREERSEMHLQREKSNVSQSGQTKVSQKNNQLTSARTEVKKEVKEKSSHVGPPIKEVEVEVHLKKGERLQKNETDIKLSPSVTVLIPKVAKITSAASHQGQSHVSASHSQQSVKAEHVRHHKEEGLLTESVVQQRFHRQEAVHMQQHIKVQAADANAMQIKPAESKGDPEGASVQRTGRIAHKDESHAGEITGLEKGEVMQKLLTEMEELEGTPSKIDSNAVRMIISQLPDWAMGSEEKHNISEIAKQQSKKKLREMMVYVRNNCHAKFCAFLKESSKAVEKEAPPTPPKPDKSVCSAASAKMSKFGIGSSKSERKLVEEKVSLQERKVHQELREEADQRVSSPLTSIRSPSPTFISIESRRIDSPLRVPSSPPLYKSVGTPPPPPRRSYTPTSTFSRATPSPTLSRSEKLMKLRDSTSKLSRDATPSLPTTVPEWLATQREQPSPWSDREISMEGLDVDVAEMSDSMQTVRDKKSFFEEAQKSEVSRMYMRKDPIDIPERLAADFEEGAEGVPTDLPREDLPKVDLSKLVNRFESPQPKAYARREPIVITERLGSDTEDAEADPPRADDVPSFNVKAIADVFETGEHGSQAARDLREQIERREPESARGEAAAGHSQTTVITEQFCVDDDSESEALRGNPPSYADVVRGAVPTVDVPPEASTTEELLRNFQQSWAESQGAFQNLGFSVTEQRTSQIVTHQQETVVTGKPSGEA